MPPPHPPPTRWGCYHVTIFDREGTDIYIYASLRIIASTIYQSRPQAPASLLCATHYL